MSGDDQPLTLGRHPAGPLCSLCSPGWGRIRHTGCTKCLGRGTNTLAYVLIVVVNAASLVLTIRTTISRTQPAAAGGKAAAARANARLSYVSQILKVG